jgi:hypothetical protein
MDKTELVMKVLGMLDVKTDSIEFGSASKGGVIKCYGDFDDPESFNKKIDNAAAVRKHAQATIGERNE